MKNIREDLAIWIQLVLSLIIWFTLQVIFVHELTINVETLKLLPEVVTLYAAIYLLFVKWLWRLPFLRGWLVPLPDLQGTWEGTLHTEEISDPIPAILVIKQTFDTISCVMYMFLLT